MSAAARCSRSPSATDLALGATGTHPWADYRSQQIIDTAHYRRVADDLRYVARRNNTFSLHVHVGIKEHQPCRADLRQAARRVCRCCSPCRRTRRTSTGRTAACTPRARRSSPRASRAAGSPNAFGSWDAYREYIETLIDVGSIIEFTQVWWSVRPHFSFGTVEVRICDVQMTAAESEGLAGTDGRGRRPVRPRRGRGAPDRATAGRLIEENMWRAIRYGMDAKIVELRPRSEHPGARGDSRCCSPGPRRCAGSSGSSRCYPSATAPSVSVGMIAAGISARGCLR